MKNKKIILLIGLILLFCLQGCQKKVDLTPNLSRLREDIFFGEDENYTVFLYPETRESPMIANGQIEQLHQAVIVKLQVKNNQSGEFTVNFTTDCEYTDTFTFSAHQDCFVTTIFVKKLPDKPFIVNITNNQQTFSITLNSLLKDGTITSQTALNKAYKLKKDYIDSLCQNHTFSGEIYLKLIAENDKNFWYVGFITDNNTLALLLSDKGELLEERNIPNPT